MYRVIFARRTYQDQRFVHEQRTKSRRRRYFVETETADKLYASIVWQIMTNIAIACETWNGTLCVIISSDTTSLK